MEIEGYRGHEEDQKNRKEPCAEIERDHQSADDLEGPYGNGEYLRRRHSRHGFKLRRIGNKQRGNDDFG